jgi:hypothetical protein
MALDVLLVLIIIGPVLAPLFDATGIWLFERIAHWIIYPLGQWICPQDHHAVGVGDLGLMAVCTRCYAAIGGLALVRFALTSDPEASGIAGRLARWWRARTLPERVLFVVGIIGLWQLDVWAERLGWWSWGHGMLIATGPIVGLAVGFLAYGLLAWLTGRRPAWAPAGG